MVVSKRKKKKKKSVDWDKESSEGGSSEQSGEVASSQDEEAATAGRNKTARDGDFVRIPRVKFSPWQSEELQKEFRHNPRPSNQEKAEIAKRLVNLAKINQLLLSFF